VTLLDETVRHARIDAEGRPWWMSPFRVFQTNLREIDAGLDVEGVLDRIIDHGSNVWLLNAGGIVSFYPTELDFQTRNPHLDARASGDLLGDAVAAAHRRGVRVVARMDFSKVGEHIARQHPEWLYIDPDGEFQVYENLYSTCPSAEYYQDAAFSVLSEVASRYPVDGFFFNWFGFNEVDYTGQYRGVSQNASSRARFAEFAPGVPLPTGPDSPSYAEWKRFSATVIEDLTTRFRRHISELLPGAAFIRGPGADVVFHEANNEIGRELWPSATSEAVSAVVAADPGRPVFVNSVAFVDMPYRLAAEEPAHYEQYIVQTLARGANPSVYIMGVPGDIDYPNVEAVSPWFRFHRDNADEYARLRPSAPVLVARPDPLCAPPTDPGRPHAEFRGVYRALQQAHIPFDVLPVGELATADLDRYAVVVVPDAGALDGPVAACLDAVAEAGRAVVLTGSSGAGGTALATSPVEEYGAEIAGRELYASYAAPPEQAGGHPRHPVVPIHGSRWPVRLSAAAAPLLNLAPPVSYGPPEKAYGNLVSDEVVAAVAQTDAGGSITVLPWTAGLAFHRLGLGVCGELIAGTVRALVPADTPVFELPAHVEVTVMSRGSSTLLHLVNLSGVQGNGFTAPLPVRDARVALRGRSRVVDLVAGDELPAEFDPAAGRTTAVLPEFGALAVIRIDPHDAARPEGERQ
jgi:hypothetical protein